MWGVVRGIQLIITHKTSTDYSIFQANGISQLFFILMTAIFVLDFLTSYFLIRPKMTGFWIGISAIGSSLLFNGISLSLALKDLESVRKAYEISRQARGLVVREELLNKIFTPEGMQATFAFSALFSIAAILIVLRNKWYFNVDSPEE
ncbi:MAG TPA: hypothetical protein PKD36_12175 [Geobacter sulfurreducens]|nr:hypothetical protein [Geobacter sulfurreducens]